MPGTDFNGGNVLWGPQLQTAISNQQVKQSRLDDMVKRVLAGWYLLGQDKGYPNVTFNSWKIGTHEVGGNHKTNVRATARDGIVLLKNTNTTLPFKKPKSIAVIGSDSIVDPKGPNACVDRGCTNGTLAVGWGSGSVEFPYLIAPLDAIKTQAQKDGTTITSSPNDNAQQGASAAQKADIAVVCINSNGGEGYITVEGNAGDRNNLDPWHNGNELVKAVAAVNKKTVVVVHSVGPVIMEQWVRIPARELHMRHTLTCVDRQPECSSCCLGRPTRSRIRQRPRRHPLWCSFTKRQAPLHHCKEGIRLRHHHC
jgi:beta-glucosidase